MMKKPKIFLTRELPPESMAILRQHSELTMNSDDRYLQKHEILAGIQGVDGLLCLLMDVIDEEILAANPDLKVVANFAVGFNNIDVEAATRHRVAVTNTPGVLTETTADMAMSLLMAAGRRVAEGDRLMRTRAWKGWEPLQLLGGDVTGATIGLIGFGRIGRAMVPRAKGFGMSVLYWDKFRPSAEEESELGVEYAEFDELLDKSDFVSLHVDLNESTHHLIGRRELGLMKESSYLINTSRGPVVDEQALVEALRRHSIAGAGLDVYENEPRLEPELYELESVVITPHIASATKGTRTKMGNMAAADCLAGSRGERPVHIVNPAILDG